MDCLDDSLYKPFGFALEFHLPYYALRKHASIAADSRKLRRSGRFICDWQRTREPENFHEAQVSLLVIGIDEWYWTAYCCADVYFGSEESPDFYLREQLDAPTGAGKPTSLPVWNPREYFLTVLSRRMKQATKEWSNIVTTLEDRLGSHVSYLKAT